ncbi:UDP-N-acetylmuramoyl-tripeptide--D-alanyl-D-alanine ligase [Anaerocolumna sedimenticola]|uniref:UDP-N-acetylmuramoyl-tripeptide--D-alanyl-D-alanine ligase n=1 Tax=Anaerocolumna sedimenticola TaxID=2696063 RepID=A0A6P1TR80_9FIRM|nr:UDP-N-acetylmuramoyl-tripeptide--D-alanyl-D-alanine ligase [Anaerocolumna sedimenticola]QHQ62035.1 UDP-N-acetylmuramoyl-tripeptide--D-alanyl-D-alanine ligase [Anaerocolumna sedimenticola]
MEALSVKEIAEAVGGKILNGDENTKITSVGTNSKNAELGSLFVPIVGERVDAHDFIQDAFANGATACFTSRHTNVDREDKVYIKVEDTLRALQALGTFYRSRFNIPVIGITGSVGKTTTKEMVAAALATKYNVLKTEGNMNSQVGLPLMMLRINSQHDIAVIEMGMSEAGEMEKLAAIAKPEAAIMTNIGVSHIAQLKTRENIRKEKLNIINCFQKSSVLFINGNDDLLSELYKDNNNHLSDLDICEKTREKYLAAKVTAFGTEEFCDYRAEKIQTVNGETHFILRKKQSTNLGMDGDGEEIVLRVLGLHNVFNALAAIAVAEQYNIPVTTAKAGLYDYQPIAMRGQIKEVNQVKIIDDSYNASPDSMKSGVHVLLELDGVKRRIAVLADVWELGELSRQLHYDVGVYIADQKIDEVITIGKDAYHIAQAIRDKKADIITQTFFNNQEVITYLAEHLKAGDGILIKGSRGMKTDEIVKAISEETK